MSVFQRSPEWFADRCGKVTASRIADIMAVPRGAGSSSRSNYIAQLVAERLTGQPAPSYRNAAMEHGIETEDQALAFYTLETGRSVCEVGFIPHPTIIGAGASPDGLVGDDGLVEAKCPQTATHIATLRGGAIPDKYVRQMQFQMACTGRAWCDFVSFDPRLPDDLQLHVRRVERDPAMIEAIEAAVRTALAEVEATIDDLNAYRKAA